MALKPKTKPSNNGAKFIHICKEYDVKANNLIDWHSSYLQIQIELTKTQLFKL